MIKEIGHQCPLINNSDNMTPWRYERKRKDARFTSFLFNQDSYSYNHLLASSASARGLCPAAVLYQRRIAVIGLGAVKVDRKRAILEAELDANIMVLI